MAGTVKTRRGLTTELVVEAALRAADAEGVDGVSLRRLATALGVTPMAIYRHVRNKSHLLDLMAERLLEQIDIADDGASAWQDRLRRLLGSYLAVAAAHPAAPFLLSRPFTSPVEPPITEALLTILHDAGFDAPQSATVLQVLSGMLLGPALHRAAWAAAMRDVDATGPQAWAESPTAEVPTPEEPTSEGLPHSMAVEPFLDWAPGPEADRLTLDLLIGGLEVLAGARP